MANKLSKLFSHKIIRLKRATKKLAHKEDGSVAVEFGFVGIPFFLLVFGILEVAMVFYSEVNLMHATNDTARKIRTLQTEIASIEEFTTDVCSKVYFIPNCNAKLKAEVQVYDDFSSIVATDPIDGEGELKTNFVFNLGQPGSVITVRTFIEWDLFAKLPDLGLGNMGNGNRLIEGFAVFRNEGALVAGQGGNG